MQQLSSPYDITLGKESCLQRSQSGRKPKGVFSYSCLNAGERVLPSTLTIRMEAKSVLSNVPISRFPIRMDAKSGSGKNNFMDLSKSPHGHSKKVHPKKSGRDSSQDLRVPVLIRTIRILTKEKHRLRERVRELAEQNDSLQREVSSFNEKEVDNRIKMSFSEKHLEDLSKRIEQVLEENQNLSAKYAGRSFLCHTQVEISRASGAKKDENINQLTKDLQECTKELGIVKAILPKVFQERDFMWEEVKSYSEMNMLLNYEINMLKMKVDTLDEDFLIKEGQITILKDWIGKHFDLLASPNSLLE
ncbi:hypothetical protein CQW23_33416 [Capsicum baccatum]|uniref:Uncharacterized protein n=1 Tax=Capsicum baccatum TaxID=33114 RepID=A0A2G2V1Y2_CAPBA|nr:hypothetical protein CQW23_33416 [Capsicum baccatum]